MMPSKDWMTCETPSRMPNATQKRVYIFMRIIMFPFP